MIKVIVSVRDSKSGYLDSRSCESVEVAVRDFKTLFAPGELSMLAMYPGDFSLVKLGEFDTSTGVIIPSVSPECLCTGFDAADYWQYQNEKQNVKEAQ